MSATGELGQLAGGRDGQVDPGLDRLPDRLPRRDQPGEDRRGDARGPDRRGLGDRAHTEPGGAPSEHRAGRRDDAVAVPVGLDHGHHGGAGVRAEHGGVRADRREIHDGFGLLHQFSVSGAAQHGPDGKPIQDSDGTPCGPFHFTADSYTRKPGSYVGS